MRLDIVKLIIITVFLLVLLGLGLTQVVKGNYYFNLSKKNCIRIIPDEGVRGIIRDANGNVIADTHLSLNISVLPQEITDQEQLFKDLSRILGLSENQIIENYRKKYFSPFSPVVIEADVSKDQIIKVLENKSNLPGVFIQRLPLRLYPYKEAAAHILGYVDYIDQSRFNRLKKYGYTFRDKIGFTGLEEYFDSYLRGEDGGRQVQIDNLGRQVKLLGIKKPTRGKDINLTIDIRMQKIAYDVLAGRRGSIIIMEPNTGRILAMASSPSFNPEVFNNPDNKERVRLLKDKSSPFLNRAIGGVYPMGSTFKVVTTIAGLESGKLTPERRFFCNGSYVLGSAIFKCWSEHGSQNLREAITHSCNVYFYNVGRILGADLMYRYAKLFGLGELVKIELPQEARGFIPNPVWKKRTFDAKWYEGDTINMSIGQGQISVTPLQALRMIAAVANGGYLVKPYLVQEIGGVDASHREFVSVNISPENLNILKAGLEDVVKAPTGTGRFSSVEGLTVAGKTGTAQTRGTAHGWFVGYAPVQNPKIAFVVMMENIGAGSYSAAIAGKMLKEFKNQQIF